MLFAHISAVHLVRNLAHVAGGGLIYMCKNQIILFSRQMLINCFPFHLRTQILWNKRGI